MLKKNTFSVIMIFAMFAIAGIALLPQLSVRLNPDNTLPSISVGFSWPGTDAYTIEREATTLLEGALNRLGNIKKTSSISRNGSATITLQFDRYADIEMMRFEVSTIIRRVFPNLPAGIAFPYIRLNRPDDDSEQAILIYTLHGPYPIWQLGTFAETFVAQHYGSIEGVDRAIVQGALTREWVVQCNPVLLARYRYSIYDVHKAINDYFANSPVGYAIFDESSNETTEGGSGYYPIVIKAVRQTEQDWENIAIGRQNDRIITLADVATFSLTEQKPSSYFRINGQNAVSVLVYPASGANSLVVAAKADKLFQTVTESLPQKVILQKTYDSSDYIKSELWLIGKRTLLTVAILLLFVGIVSLNLRYLRLILLSLLVSISISLLFYYLLGVDINLYALAGITISLGMLIDNTIVISDHLIHHKNMRAFRALLAATLTTIAALSVVLLLPEDMRLNLRDFALVVMINLAVSLIVALFFIPSLMQLLPLTKKPKAVFSRRKRFFVRLNKLHIWLLGYMLRFRKTVILIFIIGFGLPVFMLPDAIDGSQWYAQVYNSTLGNTYYQQNVKPVVDKLLGGSLRLFSIFVFEHSYYTKREETVLHVEASLPKGSTVAQMNELFIDLEQDLAKYDEISQFTTSVTGSNYAFITIRFKSGVEDGLFPYILRSRLISKSLDRGGANWNIYGVGKGFFHRTDQYETVDYKINMYGYRFESLEDYAIRFRSLLERHPRVRKVDISGGRYWWEREPVYAYTIKPDPQLMATFGLNLSKLFHQASSFDVSGGYQSNIMTEDAYYQLRITEENDNNTDIWHLMNLPGRENQPPIGLYSQIEKHIADQNIYKEDQNYIRIINYQYVGSAKYGNIHLEEVLQQLKNELPIGFRVEAQQFMGTSKKEANLYIWLVLLIMVIFLFICAILFESVRQPFAIILMVPLSFTGLFLVFYWFDINFDQGGYAALILLSGLVINAAIYILNDYNSFSSGPDGYTLKNYIRAFNSKIIPVLLTIVSTVLGLIPFLIGGQNDVFWFALAAGGIGGLVYSLLVILIVLPLLSIRTRPLKN
ncbi:MAG: efflux RND transporter permease subunit [Bacteroidales bacterium]|jgi:multidrug efflux pump subunit AcrB|nr:efflux RND transporter permease subunit [Bacteroidales bacterium]MDD3702283.1 efflux RND transporter permease subunit [Bacteroidales bacterium]MDY0369557.1 efflux RND transporter permease subunit [Bacteroidales bacterium]